jgi:rhamnogalacturonan endolyase
MHREILARRTRLNAPFAGAHFGFSNGETYAAGETMSRVCGPFFLYFNKASGAAPQATIFADAQAQAQAERDAWPDSWFTDSNYIQSPGHGTVTGKIIINDSGNPYASAGNLWVSVAETPASSLSPATADFQFFGKQYQYWERLMRMEIVLFLTSLRESTIFSTHLGLVRLANTNRRQ